MGYNLADGTYVGLPAMFLKLLDGVKIKVMKNDRDWVTVIDGEEGVGKSVLAQQVASYLDPNFNLDNIVFTSEQFLAKIKDPNTKKGTCIVLDESFNAANSRSALTEVNRSMIGVATEMRQKNLYIIMVLPTFFDLDKYFALWRCKSLLHVYFDEKENRNFIVFPKEQKKYLYLNGKKTYNYNKPRSPFPAFTFPHVYTVDEQDYRTKKAYAFRTRTVSNLAKRWKLQRDSLIKELFFNHDVTTRELGKLFLRWGAREISQREMQRIIQEERNNADLSEIKEDINLDEKDVEGFT